MRIAFFIDGTFLPERDGASTRFANLPSALAKLGVTVVVFHCYRGWSDLHQVASQPYKTYFFPPSVFYSDQTLLQELVSKEHIDILQGNDLETMRSVIFPLAETRDCHAVYEAHYHTSTLGRQLRSPACEVRRSTSNEAIVVQHCDEVIVFTSDDYRRWNVESGCDPNRLSIVPFGVSEVEHRLPSSGPQAVFIGNMYFEPNAKAAVLIARKLYPQLRSNIAAARCVIIGDAPSEIAKTCEAAGVTVLGEVDCHRNILRASCVGIAPVFQGTGVRTKILEYLSCGIPAVSTSLAAEGLMFPTLYVEDDIHRFVARCCALMTATAMDRDAEFHTHVQLEREHLWSHVAQIAVRAYEKILARPRRDRQSLQVEPHRNPMWLDEVLRKGRFSEEGDGSLGVYRFGVASGGKLAIHA
jgi:glycosyltransferase involved in cell wall biosynthesis